MFFLIDTMIACTLYIYFESFDRNVIYGEFLEVDQGNSVLFLKVYSAYEKLVRPRYNLSHHYVTTQMRPQCDQSMKTVRSMV